jgi:hypothetical protein
MTTWSKGGLREGLVDAFLSRRAAAVIASATPVDDHAAYQLAAALCSTLAETYADLGDQFLAARRRFWKTALRNDESPSSFDRFASLRLHGNFSAPALHIRR